MTAIEQDDKIIELKFMKKKSEGKSLILQRIKKNVNDFFSKKIKSFNFPYKIHGSNLQIRIWRELKKIPYGQTKSYGAIAKIVKTSPRYVGNVCGQNKHLLVIPCHRVIRTDGSLGGFSGTGGLSLKKRLLKLEKQ
jgi:O-6-methylguanine DNA methyltransferase